MDQGVDDELRAAGPDLARPAFRAAGVACLLVLSCAFAAGAAGLPGPNERGPAASVKATAG